MLQSKVETLIQKYGQDDQRTAAWHQKRGEMLTASEIYKALPDASPALKEAECPRDCRLDLLFLLLYLGLRDQTYLAG